MANKSAPQRRAPKNESRPTHDRRRYLLARIIRGNGHDRSCDGIAGNPKHIATSCNTRTRPRTGSRKLSDPEKLRQEFESFRATITEQIQGSMDANQPGIASRLQRLEDDAADLKSTLDPVQIEKRISLLENNAIQDGQALVQKVNSMNSTQKAVVSAVVLAVVGAVVNLVLG